ncbi:ABC transporter ATP-binding protein [Butyrivibrio sp. NC3005]|uniref:ABC transporter ATP-binding protein n=1 Tax=Butyrivibrio sp. NC3005 TaxID=1280685 RepID=UPI0003FB4327|nr:ABC transporter ATP-binding protein [Butyrivibrio sp. NC3005]
MKNFKLLLKWAGDDKKFIVLSLVCAFVGGLLSIGSYIGIYKLMDAFLRHEFTREVVLGSARIITVTVILRQLLMALSGVFSHKGAYGALFKVRCMITEHLAKVPLGAIDEKRTGDIKTVINEDIEKLELCLAHNIPEFIGFFTGPIVIFVYLLMVNVPLALISLIPLLISVFIMGVVFSIMSGVMKRISNSLADFNSVIIEYISGMKLVKAYNLGSSSFKKFSDAVEEEHSIWTLISKKTAPLYAAFIVVLEAGIVFLVPFGGKMYLNGSITSSVFLLFAYIGSLYLMEILPLQQFSMELAQSMNGVEKVKQILELPVFNEEGSFPEKHDIELRNVTFSYDKKQNVIENCSLKINEGEKIAVIGKSGAGKSTIATLISRYYDADKGEVLIGGKNVKNISYDKLLANISIVFQKTFLTTDSVFDNIRMGSDATLEEVREAAKKAQIDDYIMSLPEGYDTKVGSFGSRFSGGEKQRIAIARAILKNSGILILDEATSAADPENQMEIDKAIANLCKGKTVIIVAHRLSVVKMCDKVAVVENNKVTSFGTHDQVLKENDYYRKAWTDYETARDMTYTMEGEN